MMLANAMFIVGLIYVIWLNALGHLINRHVNTGMTHFVCQLVLSVLICIYHRQNGKTLNYSLFYFLLNLTFIFEFAHHNGFWCLTHPLNKKWMCDRLTEIKLEFENHNITWKLTYGSALGALRDYPKNHFGIPYEKDEDILVDTEKVDLANDILNRILLPIPWLQAASECRIDYTFDSIAKCTTKLIPYCGSKMPISTSAEGELQKHYGEDYMVPKMVPAQIGINRHIGCSIYIDSYYEPLWVARLYFLFFGLFTASSLLGIITNQIKRALIHIQLSECVIY